MCVKIANYARLNN